MMIGVSCQTDKYQTIITPASGVVDELSMKPIVDGNQVANTWNKNNSKGRLAYEGNETLIYQSATQTLSSSSVKIYEYIGFLPVGKTYRIETEFFSGTGSTTLIQSYSGIYGGTTTTSIETNNGSLVPIQNKRSLYLSNGRLVNNVSKAYVMLYRSGTASVSYKVKVYVYNADFSLQKWTNIKNYKHYNQFDYPTSIKDKICGLNVYQMARYMLRPDLFSVNTRSITAIHKRLQKLPIESYSGYARTNYIAALANGVDYDFGGFQDGLCGGPTINGRRGDLGCRRPDELNNPNSYFPWSQYKDFRGENNRNNCKSFIEYCLNNGRYVGISVQIQGTSIVESGGLGHFILIVGIDKTTDGSSSVIYYKDGLTANAETQTISYSKLLNSNQENTSGDSYQIVSFAWHEPPCIY